MSLLPFLEIVNAILSPSGCQVGEDAIPSNLGSFIALVLTRVFFAKTSDLPFLNDTYANFLWSLDQAGERIGLG